MKDLPVYLREMQYLVEGFAREYGLDFYKTNFLVLDYKTMNEVAAYGGFPSRYPHWRFGMEYDRLSKGYTYGISKIYEMVINNDPCYAYLLEGNSLTDQKLVMAHVMAHNDFFKNNFTFEKTNRHMIDEMANHSSRIRRAMDKYGVDEIEAFTDVCLSLENLIDIYSPYIKRKAVEPDMETGDTRIDLDDIYRFPVKPYLDNYINTPEYIKSQKTQLEEKLKKNRHKLPAAPTRDVLGFLMHYAPLNNWERLVLETIREESYYFAPQAMTKIMNEGWATYWHSRLMTEKLLDASEVINYADVFSGVTYQAPGQLNPYKLGLELFRFIEERWDKGRFGLDYERCDNMIEKGKWDKKLGIGRDKIFEVRRHFCDVTFLDEFLTPEFLQSRLFYTYDYNKSKKKYVITDREFVEIKEKLLASLTNRGQPVISVVDANYHNRGELYLVHTHNGVDLEFPFAKGTLENLQRVWKRPVNLRTIIKNKNMVLSWDGTVHETVEIKEDEGYA
jgi:stage V sporulation protein R